MKSQELTITCLYEKDEIGIFHILQSSFEAFLKKELHNIANSSCHVV